MFFANIIKNLHSNKRTICFCICIITENRGYYPKIHNLKFQIYKFINH